jgi:hypothetical protein
MLGVLKLVRTFGVEIKITKFFKGKYRKPDYYMKSKIFLFFVVTLMCYSCDPIDKREVTVYNKSQKTVFSILSSNNYMGTESYYIEFMAEENPKMTKQDSLFAFVFEEINPNTKVANHDGPRFWNSYVESSEGGKIRLFIVPKDSVDKYGWHKIFKSNIYIKKYELTLDDLNKKSWEVVYE